MDKFKLAQALIAHYEGFSSTAYKCPAGIWTIGFGRTLGVKPGDTTTRTAELDYLITEIRKIDFFINGAVLPLQSPEQMAALISFIYNVGQGAFARSTLLKKINSNAANAPSEILRWNKVGTEALEGLTKRRICEYLLYSQNKLKLI